MTDAQDDERLGQLFETHGHRGVLIYWWVLERVASRMDETDRCNLQTSRQHWAKMLRTYWKDVDKILGRCRDLGLIFLTSSGDLVDISCPKLLKIRARQKPIGRKVCITDIDRDVDVDKENTSSSATADEFERFWKAYPRKVGKQAALKKWHHAKINGKVDRIIAAVEIQKRTPQWAKDGGQFIPHPATWLSQGRWEDEPFAKETSGEGGIKFTTLPGGEDYAGK